MSTKIYVHLTGVVPSITLASIAKPVKITNSYTSKFISIKDLPNLFELTTRDTYNNIISNLEFRNALKLNHIKAYDEHALEIDMLENKFLDPPVSTGSNIVTKEYYITGDNIQDKFTFTHNEDTPNYKAYLYESYEVIVEGVPKEHLRECDAYFRADPNNPHNVVELVVGTPLYATLFKVVLLLFKGA